jgi:hypothetical protein
MFNALEFIKVTFLVSRVDLDALPNIARLWQLVVLSLEESDGVVGFGRHKNANLHICEGAFGSRWRKTII